MSTYQNKLLHVLVEDQFTLNDERFTSIISLPGEIQPHSSGRMHWSLWRTLGNAQKQLSMTSFGWQFSWPVRSWHVLWHPLPSGIRIEFSGHVNTRNKRRKMISNYIYCLCLSQLAILLNKRAMFRLITKTFFFKLIRHVQVVTMIQDSALTKFWMFCMKQKSG